MFWLRRIGALTVLALVVGLVVVVVKTVVPGISSALTGSGEPAPTVVTDTPSPTTTGPIGDCVTGEITASIVPRTTTVEWGKDVAFDVTLRNQGGGPCVVDGGSDATTVVVRTPAEQAALDAARDASSTAAPRTTSTASSAATGHVWSSGDCSPSQRLLLLDVGDEDAHSVVWHRERSASGCAKRLGDVGAGTYSVTVTVLGVTSDPVTVTLAPKQEPTAPATAPSTAPPSGTSTEKPADATSTAPVTSATTAAGKKETGAKDSVGD